ncbi:nucleotidyltransferase domain-containing protein [Dyadobacter fermentans]|uniref:DNA polymerase beta domain protein region n=1 Tax=Dyadobacter fermentans (strain ATCC 700827 / DSM 18053 / CIP 107007 / KCTC 52180 / NS114) TaxID=471854 RepID=C6W3H6_DYAFD|nr:nucleotidyltransferase domain-containing protein [Dyadobacter fermentans]ACT93953.1 DNA polymerase beta domain protein region [Dyadobacter fermentans DSM 18053]
MDQGINQSIARFVASASKNQPGLVAAYLFGSYARNDFRPESDIDIALVIDKLNDSERFDTQVRLMMLASQFDSRIEPHPISKQDLMSTSNPFAAEILKNGIEFELRPSA